MTGRLNFDLLPELYIDNRKFPYICGMDIFIGYIIMQSSLY